MNFAAMLRAILERTAIEKIRISSVEPMDWTNEVIELVASSPRIAKHAHVPMQSGSDRILRRMHRKYRPWHYADRIERIRRAMPDAAIGADVMVGFPGESDDDFEQTRAMIERLPFTYLHVFTYSSRPGTPSAEMPEQVPVQIARERNRVLRELAAQKKRAFMRVVRRPRTRSDHADALRRRVHRSADRQLSEAAGSRRAQSQYLAAKHELKRSRATRYWARSPIVSRRCFRRCFRVVPCYTSSVLIKWRTVSTNVLSAPMSAFAHANFA